MSLRTDLAVPVVTGLRRAEVARLRLVLLRLGRRLRKRAFPGITPSQTSALSVIERHGPLRLGELARLEQVSKSSVTRLVAKLDELALVERRQSDDDGRSSVVELTTEGRALLDESSERADAYLADQMSKLTR